MKRDLNRIGRFLSLVLRHKPEQIGLELDTEGWGSVSFILEKLGLTRVELENIVQQDEKQRYSFSSDGSMIRCNQGHSISVDLGLSESLPPNILYHGTALRYLESIEKSGLQKLNRQHVHLSGNVFTAYEVGRRHGKPVVLEVRAGDMLADGYKFYLSVNRVWLTESVPLQYLTRYEVENFSR